MVCPFCKNEINIHQDMKGHPLTNDILSMRVLTPIYLPGGKVVQKPIEISFCRNCNGILGLGKKM